MTKRERVKQLSIKLSQVSLEIDEFIKDFWKMPDAAFEVLDKASMEIEYASHCMNGIRYFLHEEEGEKNELLRRS
jgi:hypothetical protein